MKMHTTVDSMDNFEESLPFTVSTFGFRLLLCKSDVCVKELGRSAGNIRPTPHGCHVPLKIPTGLMCPDMLWKNWGGCAAASSLRSTSQLQRMQAARRSTDHEQICSLVSSKLPPTLHIVRQEQESS